MQKAMCQDGRVHGLLQFYDANRTGWWAGRLVQVQNLPRNSMPDLEEARELVKQGYTTALAMLYDIRQCKKQCAKMAVFMDSYNFMMPIELAGGLGA